MSSAEAMRLRDLNARVSALMPRLKYRRAQTDQDREAIYRLRYEAYLREGAIAEHAEERFTDAVDEQENTFLLGVYVDDMLASALRITVTLPDANDLPTAVVFPEYVRPRIEAGSVLIDPTRFVADHAFSRRLPELPYLTTRLAWLALEHFEADTMLIAIRPEHRAFYRRFWQATEVCEARPYPKLTKPVGLSIVDYQAVRATVELRYPFLESSAPERARLFAPQFVPEAIDLAGDLPANRWQDEPRAGIDARH